MEIPVLLFKTIALRPYVFIFLAAFLFSSIVMMGRRRTLVFWVGTWILAFLSEFCSTRTGFPYGWYHYTGSTRGQELFVFNVPFMDSLSYSFLLFASYSMALFTLAPLYVRGMNVQVADSFDLRGSWRVLVLTAVYMMMIDVIIDPVALQGEKWFLGKIYGYRDHGFYFGIPLSNAFGWALVALAATYLFQRLQKKFLGPGFRDKGVWVFWGRGWMGVGLYYGVLLFNLSVTAWIGDYPLLLAGIFIYCIPTAILFLRLFDPRARASEHVWKQHLEEFSLKE